MSISWIPVQRFGMETDRYVMSGLGYEADLYWDGLNWELRTNLISGNIKLDAVTLEGAQTEVYHRLTRRLILMLEDMGYDFDK